VTIRDHYTVISFIPISIFFESRVVFYRDGMYTNTTSMYPNDDKPSLGIEKNASTHSHDGISRLLVNNSDDKGDDSLKNEHLDPSTNNLNNEQISTYEANQTDPGYLGYILLDESRRFGIPHTESILLKGHQYTHTFIVPPGRLGIIIETTIHGPSVHSITEGSPVSDLIFPGDIIISVDDIDTSDMSSGTLTKLMRQRIDTSRQITVLSLR